jgi:hypothetical protein
VVTTSLDATTLVILRTPREIVVAADSLLSLYGRRPQQVCKIGRHGDTVFATAGLVESQDGVLDVHAVIAQVLRRNVSWIEHVRTIERRLQEPLLRTLRRMRRELPDEFRALAGGGFALHVSLAAFRDGTVNVFGVGGCDPGERGGCGMVGTEGQLRAVSRPRHRSSMIEPFLTGRWGTTEQDRSHGQTR